MMHPSCHSHRIVLNYLACKVSPPPKSWEPLPILSPPFHSAPLQPALSLPSCDCHNHTRGALACWKSRYDLRIFPFSHRYIVEKFSCGYNEQAYGKSDVTSVPHSVADTTNTRTHWTFDTVESYWRHKLDIHRKFFTSHQFPNCCSPFMFIQ